MECEPNSIGSPTYNTKSRSPQKGSKVHSWGMFTLEVWWESRVQKQQHPPTMYCINFHARLPFCIRTTIEEPLLGRIPSRNWLWIQPFVRSADLCYSPTERKRCMYNTDGLFTKPRNVPFLRNQLLRLGVMGCSLRASRMYVLVQ